MADPMTPQQMFNQVDGAPPRADYNNRQRSVDGYMYDLLETMVGGGAQPGAAFDPQTWAYLREIQQSTGRQGQPMPAASDMMQQHVQDAIGGPEGYAKMMALPEAARMQLLALLMGSAQGLPAQPQMPADPATPGPMGGPGIVGMMPRR